MKAPGCILRCLLVLVGVLLLALGLRTLTAPSVPTSAPVPEGLRSQVRVGDWIFRSGVSVDSRVVKQLSGSVYSHIGMVVSVHPEITIIHATTDDRPGQKNQVLVSPLAEFIQPTLAESYAIARPLFLNETQKAAIAAHLLNQKARAFVLRPRGETQLYCTTLLAEAIQREYKSFAPRWQYLDLALFRGDYLFPQAFAEYPQVQWIWPNRR